MAKRVPELDAAIRWKTFYDLLTQKQFREEKDKGVVAAIFCLSKYPANFDTIVRWKALCDVLERDPFKLDVTRRGIIAALILLSLVK
ncbi:MAG: hypothetical protein FK732_04900 [Asgard group archaeon]|nr:hypothetical protein [Asgard group archaeon]